MPPESPSRELALSLHLSLLETLKQLNRAEAEESGGDGLETAEIVHLLRRGALPAVSEAEIEHAVATLVANRMADALDEPRYAWDRGRTVGRRYAITTDGKAYLAAQLERTGRIG